MIPAGETKRLILRPPVLADAAQIQELFPHWEIVRYLRKFVPWPYPEDGALRFIRDVALPAIECGEQWVCTLRLKTVPEQIIGSLDLRKGEEDNRGILAGACVAGPGTDERSLRVGQRILV